MSCHHSCLQGRANAPLPAVASPVTKKPYFRIVLMQVRLGLLATHQGTMVRQGALDLASALRIVTMIALPNTAKADRDVLLPNLAQVVRLFRRIAMLSETTWRASLLVDQKPSSTRPVAPAVGLSPVISEDGGAGEEGAIEMTAVTEAEIENLTSEIGEIRRSEMNEVGSANEEIGATEIAIVSGAVDLPHAEDLQSAEISGTPEIQGMRR